jgi:hypothetical protein
VIAGEDPAAFEQLLQGLKEDFEPASSIEVELVARVAGYFWRLRRVPVFEAAILETRRTEVAPHEDAFIGSTKWARKREEIAARFRTALQSYEAEVAVPKISQTPETVRESEVDAQGDPSDDVQAVRDNIAPAKVDMGRALIRDGRDNDTLGKLSRYEASLLNGFDRTLRQLVAIQNTRMAREEPRQIAGTSIVVSEE